jgi:hypothetical protein
VNLRQDIDLFTGKYFHAATKDNGIILVKQQVT